MLKELAVIAAALTVPLAPILVFAGALAGPQTATQTVSATCAGWAGDTPVGIELDASQMNSAATIYAAALETGVGPAGAVVGTASLPHRRASSTPARPPPTTSPGLAATTRCTGRPATTR